MNNALRPLVLVCVIVCGGFLWWKQGSPYGEPCYSPNHQYYVQQFINWSLPTISMPGDGSHPSGYARLYDNHGRQLKEFFVTDIKNTELHWNGDGSGIFFMTGTEEGDNDPNSTWKTPTPTGYTWKSETIDFNQVCF
jgi:hypothetical protein